MTIPWYAKLILGLGIVGAVSYLLPIVELFETFLYVVVVPVMVLYAMGLISHGTLEAVQSIGPNMKNDLLNRVEAYKAAMREQEAAEACP